MSNKYSDIRWKWLEERGFRVLSDAHQYAYMQSLWAPIETVQAVFCNAKAGTGKSTLAVLAGVYEVERGTYDRIMYIRNAVPVRDMGFLPGTQAEKEAPYFAPLIQAMDKVQPGLYEKWSRPEFNKAPKVAALTSAYTRGVTWERSYIVIDEAQSFTLHELQAVLTRIDESCKVVIIGSTRQIDDARQKKIGDGRITPFEAYMEHFRGTPVTYHKLETCYRGWFADHADDVQQTILRLEADKSAG